MRLYVCVRQCVNSLGEIGEIGAGAGSKSDWNIESIRERKTNIRVKQHKQQGINAYTHLSLLLPTAVLRIVLWNLKSDY